MKKESKKSNKLKIFVTVGTHKKPFNRLLKAADELASKTDKFLFFAQTGNSTYNPKNFPFKKFLNGTEFNKKIKEADIVLSHAGAGIIITTLSLNKRLVLMPRLKKFDEHSNNHQTELALKLADMDEAISVLDEKNLLNAINNSLNLNKKKLSNKNKLVKFLEDYFTNLESTLNKGCVIK